MAKMGKAQLEAEKKNPNLKLRRLGTARLNKVVKSIRNLARVGRYGPTEKQTKAAFDIIAAELTAAHSIWTKPPKREKEEVSFAIPD